MKPHNIIIGFITTSVWIMLLLLTSSLFKEFFGFELLFYQKVLVATMLIILPFLVGKVVESEGFYE